MTSPHTRLPFSRTHIYSFAPKLCCPSNCKLIKAVLFLIVAFNSSRLCGFFLQEEITHEQVLRSLAQGTTLELQS